MRMYSMLFVGLAVFRWHLQLMSKLRELFPGHKGVIINEVLYHPRGNFSGSEDTTLDISFRIALVRALFGARSFSAHNLRKTRRYGNEEDVFSSYQS